MAYQKQTFIDMETIATAEQMNHIEDGIVQNESDIAANAADIKTNKNNITTLTSDLTTQEKSVQQNTSDISTLNSALDTTNKNVSQNTSDISTLNSALADVSKSETVEGFCSDYVSTSRVRRYGTAKTLRLGTSLLKALSSGTEVEIGTIPDSDFYPQSPFQTFQIVSSSGTIIRINISTEGVIKVTPYTAMSSGNTFDLTISYC